MTASTSIYLENLHDAQHTFVAHQNGQFRRSPSDPDNWIGPDAENYVDETIKRWLTGERVEIDRSVSPRSLDPRDALLAHLSNPGHSGCDTREMMLALILPGMVERVLTGDDASEAVTASVAPFFNGRENGLVYSVMQPNGTTRSFSVYEHRNTDSIIINGCSDWDGECRPYVGDTAHAFFAEFACGSYEQAADALTLFMVDAARGELADDVSLANRAEHRDWGAIIAERSPGFSDWLHERGVEPMDRLRDQS